MTDDAHEVRTDAAAADDDAHAGTRRCAWPDGCAHPAPELTGGRPARYCGRRVDGRLHNRSNASRLRDKLDRDAGPAHEARGAAHAPGQAPGEADFSGRSAGQQAQLLAERLDALRPALESYAEQLRLLGDVDAAGRQVEAIRHQAAAEVADAERARADAVAAAEQARAELREETEAREEADALAERATEAQEAAEAAATDARQHADRAQADAERARTDAEQQVADAHRTAEADAAEVRAERDRILAEHQAAHAAELQQVRDQTAHEVEQVRAEAARATEAARRDAHEADQARARAEQRAQDAEQQMTWLREQLSTERTQHQEALDRVRADAEARVQPLLADTERLRAELAAARDEHAAQLRTALALGRAAQHQDEEEDETDDGPDLTLPWTEGLPAPLIAALRTLAEHGAQPASRDTGIRKEQATLLRRVTNSVSTPEMSTGRFRQHVLGQFGRTLVDEQLRRGSPQLAADITHGKELSRRYLAGDDLDGDQDQGAGEPTDEDQA